MHSFMISQLLSRGAVLNSTSGGSSGPGQAAARGQLCAVEYLLDHGASGVPRRAASELLLAANSLKVELVKPLLNRDLLHRVLKLYLRPRDYIPSKFLLAWLRLG